MLCDCVREVNAKITRDLLNYAYKASVSVVKSFWKTLYKAEMQICNNQPSHIEMDPTSIKIIHPRPDGAERRTRGMRPDSVKDSEMMSLHSTSETSSRCT